MSEELQQGARVAAEVAKDPTSYHWLTYLWVIGLAVWGGIVKALNEFRSQRTNLKDGLVRIGTGVVTSGLVGVITFWLCEAQQIEPLYTAALVAVSGHLGAESFTVMQRLLKRAMSHAGDMK